MLYVCSFCGMQRTRPIPKLTAEETATPTPSASPTPEAAEETTPEQTGDTAFSVNVTVDLLDDREGAVTGMECWAFPYVLENGRWGFSDFRLVY